jgi:hypothetical protein
VTRGGRRASSSLLKLLPPKQQNSPKGGKVEDQTERRDAKDYTLLLEESR